MACTICIKWCRWFMGKGLDWMYLKRKIFTTQKYICSMFKDRIFRVIYALILRDYKGMS